MRKLALATVVVALTSCDSQAPAYEVVGQQGVVRLVVVASSVASRDDSLYAIADTLRQGTPNQTIQVMFWTDKTTAATSLPLSDRALQTQVAQININPSTGLRQLTRN